MILRVSVFLATLGLNIYDGSIWSLGLAALGEIDEVYNYMKGIINSGETCQFPDIRGDAPCRGDIIKDQCQDPGQGGSCGFCYGDGADRTAPRANAFTFRMISDYWALQGTIDPRCPDLQHLWTWNDYRPVLGENAWANLLAPLQVAFMKYKSVKGIPSSDLAVSMALKILPTLAKLETTMGALYYAPHNTLESIYYDLGFSVSTENNVSLLGGLRALRYYILVNQVFTDQLALIDHLIERVTSYVKSSYSPHLGYFVQGGSYNPKTMKFAWATGSTMFAVDCQTWTMSNISPKVIDGWFGEGTCKQVWENTKKLSGFNLNPATGWADGVGFTSDDQNTIFSGEWTMGAVNMLKIFAEVYGDPRYLAEADHMRLAVQNQLLIEQNINGNNVVGISYSNKRYYIPFGWWANPVLSTASTGWAVLYDVKFNPFHLGGEFVVDYPL